MFQTNITLDDAGQVTLRNLPFRKGERVRVVVESEKDAAERTIREKQRALELFQKIAGRVHDDPRFESLTDQEIADEIAAYRRGE